MSEPVLRVVSVGVGGRARAHFRAFTGLPEKFEATALVDISPNAFTEARQITGLPESACFATLQEALGSVECDVVGVFTPGHLHTTFMEEAIASGKHVIVEKPFTCDLGEAERVVAAADKQGVRVLVTQNDRFFPMHLQLREWIADRKYGELGAITMVHHNARGNPFENGYPPSHLWHQGSHQLDTLLSLVQRPPRRLWGLTTTPAHSAWPAESHVSAIIEFDGPVVVSYTATSDAQAYEMYLRVECGEAALTLSGFSVNNSDSELRVTPRQPRVRHPRSEVFPQGKPERLPGVDGTRTGWAGVELNIWANFWDHVVNGTENETSGANNLHTMRVLDGIIRSTNEGAAIRF